MNKIDLIETARLRTDLPEFRPGDTVKVHVRVVEGNRERIQVFQGVVIRRQGGGLRETFTVRKISFNGVGVERLLVSPELEDREVVVAVRLHGDDEAGIAGLLSGAERELLECRLRGVALRRN